MAYQYSSFFSYRRNDGQKLFMRNLKVIIETEGLNATNKSQVFFDEDSIDWGKEFDNAIYTAISESYSFVLILTPKYLHPDNIWCAKEVYRAIEVEKVIRAKLGTDDWCFILPLIFRGPISSLPSSINAKNAIPLQKYETGISNSTLTDDITEFKTKIHDTILRNHDLVSVISESEIEALLDSIDIPSDDVIIEWIREQRIAALKAASTNPPKLK